MLRGHIKALMPLPLIGKCVALYEAQYFKVVIMQVLKWKLLASLSAQEWR